MSRTLQVTSAMRAEPSRCSIEAGGKVFISDAVNHWVMVVRFDHDAEESCEVR